jgi:predicted DNA-binding WGR domain protein
MSDWTVHLEFEEGTSSKFWRARVEGKTLYVNYGRIGTTGQTQVKDFPDSGSANKEYAKLVAEKRRKGYIDQGGALPPDEDDDDLDDEEMDEDGDEDEAPRKPARPSTPPRAAAPPPRPAGQRMVYQSGARRVETFLSVDGATVRMEAIETYTSPDAAKKAHDRLKKQLMGEGYRDG